MVVRVVTDSTADLPPDLIERWGITVVPLTVHFGEETFRDGVDLGPDEFYRRLQASSVLPRTSQPSPGAFAEVYDRLARGHDEVLSIHISSKLSGTYSSARQAKETMGVGRRIEVLDSAMVSLGLGLVVLEAARGAAKGLSLDEARGLAVRTLPTIRVACLLDTLDYLHKGGRVGKAAALLGSLLQVKPLITVRDGEVHPLERARTWQRAKERLFQLVPQQGVLSEVGVVYSTDAEDADALAHRIQAMPSHPSVTVGRFGPVLGTYVGPGALGVAWREAP